MSSSLRSHLAYSSTFVVVLGCSWACSVPQEPHVALAPPAVATVVVEAVHVDRAGLYPEGIDIDPQSGRFVLGSFREGGVYTVAEDGSARRLVDDARLTSVVGVRVDAERRRVLVANSDLGASVRASAAGPRRLATLGIYDLDNGAPQHFVDLAALRPDGAHLANALALDPEGNAYVTDSFSPVIYRVDLEGHATVFVEDERFEGEGINLNGVVYHPGGFLLVAKKSDGKLFRISVEDPESLTEVVLDESLPGADGLVLVSSTELAVVANQASGHALNAVIGLESEDGWNVASETGRHELGDVYPTTGVVRGGSLFVLSSRLNRLILAEPADKSAMRDQAMIRPVGTVEPLKLTSTTAGPR
ncbi:MAG: hypothetical protein KUG77_28955 [Nannocystaceae bacterium]|nr:hypothetical protein [Nannocystaceae bacterium]